MDKRGQAGLLWGVRLLFIISVIALGLILYNVNLENTYRDKYGFSSNDLVNEIKVLEKGIEVFITTNKNLNSEQENELLKLQDELFILKQLKEDFTKNPLNRARGQKISTGSKILEQAKERLSNIQTLDEKPNEIESGRSVSQ